MRSGKSFRSFHFNSKIRPKMKKKKQSKSNKDTVTVAKEDADLESMIHSYSQFFDYLIELIPVKFYLPNEDADSKPWYQGLNKAAKASLKQQSKQNLKLARRQRFDPESESVSTLNILQLQQNSNTHLPEEGNVEEDSGPGAKAMDVEENKQKSVTFEELREKLRRRIELLRGNRGEKNTDEKKDKNNAHKRKRGGDNDGGQSGKPMHSDQEEDAEETIEYGKVRLVDEDEGRKKKKRKLSKVRELERAERLKELKSQNPSVAERESWKAATSRAMGVKVHDDARLIKESMKKDKRKKEKNAEKWKDRVETQEKMKKERQQKRTQNIVGRINEKKTRRIAKREKKLMRPGFEGRKEGYITNE